MAGSISLSLSQQFDSEGRPLSGGLLYFLQSGTTTPQSAFQDTSLTIPYSNPIVLDASGRIPAFYLADGFIKIRLTDSAGVTVIAADGILVIGPSSGGGGGGSVDPTTVLATGDVKARYGVGVLSGFVRCNGRTLGSATSGATERAYSDAQALFESLWTADPNLTVSTGRGASGNADWIANKNIALPDMRGRAIAGMDDMGATQALRLGTTFWGANAQVLGAAGGSQSNALSSSSQIPPHTHLLTSVPVTGTTGNESATHTHGPGNLSSSASGGIDSNHQHDLIINSGNISSSAGAGIGVYLTTAGAPGTLTTGNDKTDHHHPVALNGGASGTQSANHTHAVSGTASGSTDSTGSSVAFATASPSMVMTFYMKL
jgi:hypothetical protein